MHPLAVVFWSAIRSRGSVCIFRDRDYGEFLSRRWNLASYIGAIDQGTTSTRFIVFDRTGQVVSVAQKEHQQIYPNPGWVEHDPEEIWQRTQEVIAEAMQKRDLSPSDLAAVGITNQRETTVLWNRKTGKPLAHALVWQDARIADDVAQFAKSSGQDRFRPKTGLPLTTYFSGLKIRWLLKNVRAARELAESGDALFGNIDSFLVWHLTGGRDGGIHITDVTNASRTQLMNLETLSWDREILDTFEIPETMLPRICSSSETYGLAKPPSLKDVAVAGILGDQQAALVGQTCFEPGEAKNTYGTGCFLLMNTGTRKVNSTSGLLTTLAYKLGNQPAHYALEGSIAITGALVQWVRDNLGLIQKSSDIESLARTVTDNGGVYFVPAFSGLYAPYWKDNARGVITGLTRYANKGHLARAVLEATAFQTRDVLEAMEKDSSVSLGVLRTDGGMVDDDLLMQFQADILNRPVVRPATKDATTALGAAYAAGLAVGYFKDLNELRANWAVDRTWKPNLEDEKREEMYKLWKRAVTRSFDWVS
jgi:glycerol kinase